MLSQGMIDRFCRSAQTIARGHHRPRSNGPCAKPASLAFSLAAEAGPAGSAGPDITTHDDFNNFVGEEIRNFANQRPTRTIS